MTTITQPLALAVGRTYRAKCPARIGFENPLVNDRTIVWMDGNHVKYNGPAVAITSDCPRVTIAEFLAWADRDVTDELPSRRRATWPPREFLPDAALT